MFDVTSVIPKFHYVPRRWTSIEAVPYFQNLESEDSVDDDELNNNVIESDSSYDTDLELDDTLYSLLDGDVVE